jgi:electron transfer flavoprotein alpha subunit
MATLLIAEHNASGLKEGTHRALSAALSLQSPIHVLVAGYHCAKVAHQAALLKGVDRVILVDDEAYANQLVEPISDLIFQLTKGYSYLISPATCLGKGVMPRVAARLDVMQVSEITKVIDHETFERPIYAGNAIQTVRCTDRFHVITVRTAAFEPAPSHEIAAPIEARSVVCELNTRSRFVVDEIVVSARPELGAAKTVVSGGRALGSKDNFENLITPLADTLTAATGASRAAVDAGYAPNDWQVGQTGKVVAPELYIAIGISGAIQHLAGMKDSKIIVAINKDAEAPIFQVADFGLVGDLFVLVPELIQKLAAKKA